MDRSTAPSRIEALLAEWVLERLAAERVPALAITALEEGCQAATVAVLAGLMQPTRADIEDHLPRLLYEIGAHRPSPSEALKVLVDLTAHEIVAGELDPAPMWRNTARTSSKRPRRC
jgi:hypothetical protein